MATGCRGNALSSYLQSCVTFEAKLQTWPVGALAPQLASRDWHCDLPLRIEDRHVATVEIRDPGSPSPLTCEVLHELDFEARWCTTLHGLGAEGRRAELGELRKRWRTKQKGIGALLTEIVTRNPFAGRTDPEVDQALLELDVTAARPAKRPFALAHGNVHVWGDTAEQALDRAGQVASLLKAQGMDAARRDAEQHLRPLGRHAGQRHRGDQERPPGSAGAGRRDPRSLPSPGSAPAAARTRASAARRCSPA